jgi:hypothetical protein
LEDHGNAKSIATRGSKLILYVRGENPGTPLRRQVETLGRMSDLIAKHCLEVAQGEAGIRLTRLGKFHRKLQEAMQSVVDTEQGAYSDEVTDVGNAGRDKDD